ncbi:hypothetical protein FRC10_004935 [Ceratobasidium sp. 414]|nr:hypothetical protein FRC10_004935 [Ceratobasidium sp. 414]
MSSLGAVPSASTQSHYERAISRRTLSLLGDIESGYLRDVFEVPHPPWAQEHTKSDGELAGITSKKVREFYERQNQTLAKYSEVDELLSGELVHSVLHSFEHPTEATPLVQTEGSKREKNRERLVSLAINLNFALNIVLLTAKGVAVLLSGSVSIWASFVDSFMDFVSTAIVIWTSFVISSYKKKGNGNQGTGKYPTGKQRMEPLGVVIFSVFMIAMFLQVGVEGIKRLLAKENEAFNLDKTTLIIMLVTLATKTVAFVSSLW